MPSFYFLYTNFFSALSAAASPYLSALLLVQIHAEFHLIPNKCCLFGNDFQVVLLLSLILGLTLAHLAAASSWATMATASIPRDITGASQARPRMMALPMPTVALLVLINSSQTSKQSGGSTLLPQSLEGKPNLLASRSPSNTQFLWLCSKTVIVGIAAAIPVGTVGRHIRK